MWSPLGKVYRLWLPDFPFFKQISTIFHMVLSFCHSSVCSTLMVNVFICFSWDDSSSISSGLSEGDGECSENLSSEEFNASSSLNSLPSTPLGSRRNSSVMVSCKFVMTKLMIESFWSCKSGLYLKHFQEFSVLLIVSQNWVQDYSNTHHTHICH